MNPLSLVKIVTPIPEQMQSDEEAFSFLDTIGEKVKACKEAFALIKLTKAKRYLTKGDNYLVTKVSIKLQVNLAREMIFITGLYRILHPAHSALGLQKYQISNLSWIRHF